MNLGDRDVSCANLFPTRIGQSDKRVESLFVETVESDSVSASTISLGGTDLQTTLNSLAGGSLTADWNSITNKPSDEAFVDWTQDQGDTNINANNYINTTYSLASNGQAGLTNFNFTEARKNKLAAIADGAQVNVQSDWNETETNADAFIQNKPTIPSAITGTSDVPGLDTALASKMPKSGGTFTGEIVLDQTSTDTHAFLSITKAGSTFMDVDTAGQFTFHRNLIINDPSEIRGHQYNNPFYTMTWKGDKDGLHVYQDGVLTFPSISDVEAAINLNSNKVGITQSEQDAIVVNSAKVSYPGPPSWSQVTNKPDLQLPLDAPVVNSPSGTGNLTLSSSTGYNTLLTYTPPDLSGFVETTGDESIAGVKTFTSNVHFATSSVEGNHYYGSDALASRIRCRGVRESNSSTSDIYSWYIYLRGTNMFRAYNLQGSTLRIYHRTLSLLSDDRYKHNEIPITNALQTVGQLQPKTYQMTAEPREPDFHGELEEGTFDMESGFIAQEVKLIPELTHLVDVQEDDTHSINYNGLIPYTVGAIQELHQLVLSQAATLETQAQTIQTLETRLNRLTSMFDAFHE
jgi:hypothetical protein